MAKLIDKVMNLVGWEEEEYYEDEQEELAEETVKTYSTPGVSSKKTSSRVVNIHSQGQFKVVILQPEDFEQSREICEHLKSKKPVIVNVEDLEKTLAQRIVDFLSGAVYALNGNIQKVSQGILLIAPNNVDIMGGMKSGEKGTFPWIK